MNNYNTYTTQEAVNKIALEGAGSGGTGADAPQTQDAPLAVKITEVGAVTYVAEAEAGTTQATAAWRAKKIDETSGTVITWAGGNADFVNAATNLPSLSYS